MKFKTVLFFLCCFYGFLLRGQVTSNFNANNEGWMVEDDANGSTNINYNATNGNPGGHVSGDDGFGLGQSTLYFVAPAKFRGNQSPAYGNTLSFDLRSTGLAVFYSTPDIILEGGGLTLMGDIPQPNSTWQRFSINMLETSWTIGRGGPNPTRTQFQNALCNITKLRIRCEYRTGPDEGYLDNVTLGWTACPANITSQMAQICAGQSIVFRGRRLSTMGIFRDTVRRCFPECDSIIELNLTVLPPLSRTQNLTICAGQSVRVNNRTYNQTGIYRDTLRGVNACDSILLTNLTVNPVPLLTLNVNLCAGDSVQVGTKFYKQAGVYRDTFQTNQACDSIQIRTIVIQAVYAINRTIRLCAGDSLRVGIKTYKQTGISRDTLKTRAFCDSILITNLIINDTIKTNQTFRLCGGNSIRVSTKTYSLTGIYRDTLRSFAGCDSIVVTDLTVSPLSSRTIDTTICMGNNIRVNGKTYAVSGIFFDTIRRPNPLCDSLLTIKLSVQTLSTETRAVTLCGGDTLKLNGRIITKSGTYTDTIIPIGGGCNQVVTYTVKTVDLSVKFGDDITIERGDSVKLSPSVSLTNGIVLKWRPEKEVPCKTCLMPIVSPRITKIYELEARDSASGCASSDDILITVNACSKIFIPNSFSPNNDTQNDYFSVFAAPCVKQVRRLAIYNRWGNLIFLRSNFPPNDEKQGWDGLWNGTLVQTGVYVYLIELDLKDGTTERYGGDVSLMR